MQIRSRGSRGLHYNYKIDYILTICLPLPSSHMFNSEDRTNATLRATASSHTMLLAEAALIQRATFLIQPAAVPRARVRSRHTYPVNAK